MGLGDCGSCCIGVMLYDWRYFILNTMEILRDCDGVLYEFVRNSKGTLIKKCCASCLHKIAHDSDGPRRGCVRTGKKKIVMKNHCCRYWEMSPAINKVKTSVSIMPEEGNKI